MSIPTQFFGLTIPAGKTVSQTVEQDFRVTMACLGKTLPKNASRTCVTLTVEEESFTLCALTPSTVENQQLDISVMEGDHVTFTNHGNCPVDLTGNHFIVNMGDEDFSDEELDSDVEELNSDGEPIEGELEEEEVDMDAMQEVVEGEDEEDSEGEALDEKEVRAMLAAKGLSEEEIQDMLDGNAGESEDEDEEMNEEEIRELLASKGMSEQEIQDMLDGNAADSDEEMTEEEIRAILTKKGLSEEEIQDILSGETEADSTLFDSEGDDEGESLNEEEIEALLTGGKRKAAAIPKDTDGNAKKAKIVEVTEKTAVAEKPKTKAEKKLEAKKAHQEKKQAEAAVKAEKKEAAAKVEKKDAKVEKKDAKAEKKEAKVEAKETENKIRTLGNGLVIEEVTIGTGPKAKNGKKVSVRYIGKLASNGKVFDSNTKGAPFSFKLGKGEVIKGWDIGVSGMNVGGTRVLTIPANLAYGAKGAPPDIPGNATLKFEVKLLQVAA